ncbi:MAG: tRNA (adenosine(37)-N6)-threonylcarbamoyltransferase complex dimerization subunit type 1 TsaB [Chloroflexi bacterium]|nr:MAG: tRNA (adenosine(37)-N6)-threonylcarbamoyltransferase complex dimerization subunit type 1 TsaB [Anaerolineaceae bacterium 4572_32.2]RLC78365.1 MAG: tRNA (adenosine(37)-N6)-threonylcarbamoyltransferase complex dimerization subunit type 1 TsaB [Chloroflexota bacterium]RLC84272.1 MAG: tRNA (adenosine(37)-N6)-threonylcarbamoyltransferase complex dimerization subunit type 1 TsaB [Chloroflexota bacterium]HEY71777.1 tRNA (adenosine(37)-N6)-threonylcarbamoyltransferase complex dimerization subuni
MLVAIDTATGCASLALHDGVRVRAEHTWESPRRHTVELLPRLTAALEQLGLGAEHLSGVAVTRGPGSFTGLRVGLSVAKGLAMARGLPLVGVPTLDVVAAAQGRDRRPMCAVLQAGRRRICVAVYRWRKGEWRARQKPRLTTWPALAEETTSPTLFCGEVDPAGANVLAALDEMAILLPAATRLRRAGFLAEVAWRRLNQGETDDPATLTPLYLQTNL